MKSENEFLFSILKHADNEVLFSLNDQFCFTFFNNSFLESIKIIYGRTIKTGESLLQLVKKNKGQPVLDQIKKVIEGEIITEVLAITETEKVFSIIWQPVIFQKKVVGINFVGILQRPLAKTQVNFEAKSNLFENLDKVNKAIQNSDSPENLIRNVFDEVFNIFDINKAFSLYPCLPGYSHYTINQIALTQGNKTILRKVREIKETPYINQQLNFLSDSKKPILYGYGTDNPLPPEFTTKFGLKTYIAITLRPKNDHPWLFGFNLSVPGIQWNEEKLLLLQEIGQRLSDGLGSILTLNDLSKREKEYQTIVNALPDLLFRISKNGTITDFKKPSFLKSNFQSADFIGKKLSAILPKDACKKAYLALKNTFKNQAVEVFEFEFDIDKNHYYVEARVIQLFKNEALFVVRNITDRMEALMQLKKRELEFHSLVENLPSFVGRFDLNGRFIYINHVALNAYLMKENDFIGKNYLEINPGKNSQSNKELYDNLLNVISLGKPITKIVTRIIEDRVHYFEVKFIPEKSETGKLQSILGISDDITEKRLAQVEIERINRALRMLGKINEALNRILEEQELIESVCRIIVELGGYKLAWVGYKEYDDEKSVRPAAFFGDDKDYIINAKPSWDENNKRGNGPAGIVARSGKTYIINDINHDQNFAPWKEAAIKNGFNSIIALPLTFNQTIFGVIGIYSIETGLFESQEVELLFEMANNLAFGIHAARNELTKRLAQQELAKSEKRNRLLLEGITDYHFSIDLNNLEPFVEVRQAEAFYSITGFTADNIISNRDFWYNLIVKDDLPLAMEYRQAIFMGKEVNPIEYRIICKNGAIKWIHDKKILIRDLQGNPISIEGVVKDITLQKNAEEALKKSEERFSKVFKLNPFSLAIYDFESFRIVDLNQGFTNLTGYTYEEAIGKTSEELKLFYDKKELAEIRKKFIQNGLVENFEFKIRKKTGEILIGLNTTIEIYIGNKQHYFSIVQNITARKNAENELHKLLMAIEQSPVSVMITDIKGDIEYVNPKFTEVTGYEFEEIKGKNPRFLKSGKLSSDDYIKLWETIFSGKEWFGEFHNKKKNGELFWEFASISPVFNNQGLITNYIAVKEDITDKKNTDRKILNTIIDTEEKERTKFSRELHDGLGPILSTVKLYFQWLAETPAGPKREQIIHTGMQNINEALQTIKEISNRLSPRILNNIGLLAAMENLVKQINETKKVSIIFFSNLNQRLEPKIEIALYRINSELLNNSLKHSEAKNVTLNIVSSANESGINIIYTDDGKGFDFSHEILSTGFGLQNIIQRVKSLDGSVKFLRKPEQMNIEINIPI